MRKFLDKLYDFSGYGAALFILAICLVVMAQVTLNLSDNIAKYITGEAIGLTIPSYADFTGYFLAAASFMALAHTLKSGGHIRVTLLLQILSQKNQRLFEIWCLVVAASMAIFFTVNIALLLYESFIYNDLSPGIIAIPIWIAISPMLLGMAILAIALVDETLIVIKGNEPSYAGKGENLLGNDNSTINAE